MLRNKLSFSALLAVIFIFSAQPGQARSGSLYLQMSPAEQAQFVDKQARRIARELSGSDYAFTPEFSLVIQRAVDSYARRIGNGGGDRPGQGEIRFVFKRGELYAPTLIAAFKTRDISPLFGLYIPLIESEYVNLESPNMMGAIGMFQFLPQTGKRLGLTPQELLNVEKSADAAARYLLHSIELFQNDPMKEALALLSYNRGGPKVLADLATSLNDQNRGCSICALTASSSNLDATFQTESVYYVPRFFAAAIVGENPRAFGLETQPLSSFTAPQ